MVCEIHIANVSACGFLASEASIIFTGLSLSTYPSRKLPERLITKLFHLKQFCANDACSNRNDGKVFHLLKNFSFAFAADVRIGFEERIAKGTLSTMEQMI